MVLIARSVSGRRLQPHMCAMRRQRVHSRQRLRDWALLVTATALFAPGFTVISITVPTITPLSITAGRMMLATCVLYGWARALGQHLPPWRDETGRLSTHWRVFFFLGLV